MRLQNDWWIRQFFAAAVEVFQLYKLFREDPERCTLPYVNAVKLYEECCEAYELREITFWEFIEIGKACADRRLINERQCHEFK